MIGSTVSQEWHGEEVKVQGKRVAGKSAYEIGLVVEGQAKELCPVKTGRLKGSITTASYSKQTMPQSPASGSDTIKPPDEDTEVLVGTAVEYGPYIEFGTVRSDAQTFLRPALDLAKGEVMEIVKRNGRFEFKKYLKE